MNNQQIALITGGSRGLGKSMALHLADEGKGIVLTYHTQKEAAEQVVDAIRQKGQKAVALQLDVSDATRISSFVEELINVLDSVFSTNKLDYLINNAGVGAYQPIANTTSSDLDYLFNIHFKSPYLLAKEVSTLLREGGSIINVSSGYSRFSAVGFSAYGALKAAIDTLTRFQTVEFAPLKIRVNSIAPGAIETDFAGGLVRDTAEINLAVASQTALGRTGQPTDIGQVVAFLASDASGWINGERIEVSGGIYL